MKDTINVGLVGASFMGKAHSHAYLDVNFFFDGLPKAVKKILCDNNEELVKANASKYQWESTLTSYEEMVKRDDIDLVDVCVPGNLHKDVVLAAAKAGKDIICEKPLANNLADAREMLDAVNKAGVKNMVAFCYRRVPAIQLAKKLISEGAIGKINHVRAVYLQDWLMDPNFPLVWRLKKESAGTGSHGDLNAHIVDLARFLVGEFDNVVGMDKTFIKRRPVPTQASGLSAKTDGVAMGDVTVDDATLFLANFKNGAIGSFEGTRFAGGHKNDECIEINGTEGSLKFRFERMNELEYWSMKEDINVQGFRTILVTEATHPYMKAWWPAGHVIGYEHNIVHEVRDMLEAIAADKMPEPSFEDGVKCQEVLEAVEKSIAEKRWVSIDEM